MYIYILQIDIDILSHNPSNPRPSRAAGPSATSVRAAPGPTRPWVFRDRKNLGFLTTEAVATSLE